MLNFHKPKLLILGAGGFGQSIAELATSLGRWSEVYFVDDCWLSKKQVNTYNIVSNIVNLENILLDGYQAIVAVGNNRLREQWSTKLKKIGVPLISIIHPNAVISPSALIAPGVIIMAGCVIGTAARLGEGVILNSGVLLDHDVEIGYYSHLSLGVKISGTKKVTVFSFLEAGTIIGQKDH